MEAIFSGNPVLQTSQISQKVVGSANQASMILWSSILWVDHFSVVLWKMFDKINDELLAEGIQKFNREIDWYTTNKR